MTQQLKGNIKLGFWIVSMLMVFPALMFGQTVFSFSVANLEAYDRTGNWAYDADNPGFPSGDTQHFTFNATSPHYYAEKKVHAGTTPGKVTAITCLAADPSLAPSPSLLNLYFKNLDNSSSDFELVSFTRVNTTNPLGNWYAAGEAGDVRVYSNAKGQLEYNGVPKLYLKKATFVITTPYPNQASMRLIPGMGGWTGNIGNGGALGLPQTGYGFGELDTTLSDPAWLAPFAASNYMVDMNMVGILSTTNTQMAWFNFTLNIAPAALPENSANTIVDLSTLAPGNPVPIPFANQNANVNLNEGTKGGATANLSTFYVNEIKQTPAGNFPGDLPQKASKYWQIGSTLSTFSADVRFTNLAKANEDWIMVTRVIGTSQWYKIPEFVALGLNALDANMQFSPWNGSYWEVKNVQRALEFSLASPDVPLAVTLSSFSASINSGNMIALAWATSAETALRGFKVYYNSTAAENEAICLSPSVIEAQNISSGANYSFVASTISDPGTYYFWLEVVSLDGSSEMFGPISKSLESGFIPPLPGRSSLGDAYPNPFRKGSESRFEVQLKAGEQGEVNIYNVTGQVIKTMKVDEGIQQINWDGKDKHGNSCGSGIYFYKLSTPSVSQTKKMVIFK